MNLKDMRACYRVVVKGIVRNGQGEILFVKERGTWDLPGGGLEHGEDVLVAVTREFKEELNVGVMIDEASARIIPTWNAKFDAPVCMVVYLATIQGEPSATNDVSECGYFSLEQAKASADVFDTTIPAVLEKIFA
jgi:8-oxo-dGTP diphosphatase